MARVEKKIWPEYFEEVISGKKKFELRLADFDLAEGDTLLLREWDPKSRDYTGQEIEKKVGYLLKLNIDKLGQKEEIEKHGFYIIEIQ